MARGIAAYVLTLLCGGAFYLFYPGYLSYYTLLLLLSLPLLSLVFTLLARRRCALSVTVGQSVVKRGEEVFLRLTARGPAGERVKLTYRLENLLHPETCKVETITLTAGQAKELPLPTGHCGWLKFTPLGYALPGWLGILALPLPLPEPTLVLVTPLAERLSKVPDLSPQTGARLQPRPGGGPGEEYELRPYRPGDPVHAIHWKLTAKQPGGEPILRETMEPVQTRLAVSYDHFGSPEELDDVFDQLQALAQQLIDKEYPFTLCWSDPATQAFTYHDIDCQKAWDTCYRKLAAIPAPPVGAASTPVPATLPGRSGPVKHIHLTAFSEEVTPP